MLQTLIALVRLTATEPRRAALVLLKNTPTLGVSSELAVIVVCLGAILSGFLAPGVDPQDANFFTDLLSNPILLAIVQLMLLMISVILIQIVGQVFGGTARFDQTLALMVWMQFFMLLVQVALIPAVILPSSLAGSISLAINIYVIWLLVNFVAALHSFQSLWRVFAGIFATTFAVIFVILLLLAMIGLSVGEP